MNIEGFDPDRRASEWIREGFSSPLSQDIMEKTTLLGDGRNIILFSTFMTLGDKKLRRCGEMSLMSFGFSGALVSAVKISVSRRRPDGGDHSFPSGHTSNAFSTATIISCEYPQYRAQAFFLASAVGLSRIALNRHWTSDVIAGACLGIASGFLVEKIYTWVSER
ncbi:phosphatase PAP2 family protein [candidate division WOR-3 bacterium]|nr:phosphatase PAP2 family protein [candidate division WOR-3 bacterium]